MYLLVSRANGARLGFILIGETALSTELRNANFFNFLNSPTNYIILFLMMLSGNIITNDRWIKLFFHLVHVVIYSLFNLVLILKL